MSKASNANLGFRVVGPVVGERRLVTWQAALAGAAQCDTRAEVERESYLSAFAFPDEMRHHLAANRSTKGYDGPCAASWLWIDIDASSDLQQAMKDAQRVCAGLADRYRLDGNELLAFFSGAKGFHVGLPLSLCGSPRPSLEFHKVAKHFALANAERLRVTVDSSVYDRVRLFRAPNSRHPRSGLHKRRIEYGEMLGLSLDTILEMARTPEPFEIPPQPAMNPQAAEDWRDAVSAAQKEGVGRNHSTSASSLNQQTLGFICHGAPKGERANRLFSAAANLAEYDCPPELARALLMPAALDSGLTPSEACRQITCGLDHGGQE